MKRVIAWVRTNADTISADPTTLFLAGSSSGGQLAALAGLTANDPSLQPSFESVDTR